MDSDSDFDDDLLASVDLDAFGKQDIPLEEYPLSVPDQFKFPFEPYDIQVDFMRHLYSTIEKGQIGIFESPTGTGKSMSLICGALTWLFDNENRTQEKLNKALEQEKLKTEKLESLDTELDWITEFAEKKQLKEKNAQLKIDCEKKSSREQRFKKLREKAVFKRKMPEKDDFDELFDNISEEMKKEINDDLKSIDSEQDEDLDIILDDYSSDSEDRAESQRNDHDDLDNEQHVIKIFYCSRTHSQLTQFVREIQNSPFADVVNVVSLASRKNLCINSDVSKLHSNMLINERCLELRKNNDKVKKNEKDTKRQKTSTKGCPFHKQKLLAVYMDRIMMKVCDIEELVTLGRRTRACPYYGTRLGVPIAQLVALPYQILLHKDTRKSSNINLKGHIVVIDEAHNLLDTINNIHSIRITGQQISLSVLQLENYISRFKSRLKAKNLLYVRQLLHVLKCLLDALTPAKSSTKGDAFNISTINDFLVANSLDSINLFKVKNYCERSMISRKLHGFAEKYTDIDKVKKDSATKKKSALGDFLSNLESSRSKVNAKAASSAALIAAAATETSGQRSIQCPLIYIENFIESLTTSDKNARVVISRNESLKENSLKLLMLNPAVHFENVLRDARAVILAGGTMKPLDEFKQQLFYSVGIPQNRISEFSCGHVIPAKQLMTTVVESGPSNLKFNFTYEQRNDPKMISELGALIVETCRRTPGGVVCFFPSYAYSQLLHDKWSRTGVLGRISTYKKVFQESKSTSAIDEMLAEYADNIKSTANNEKKTKFTGSILFSVVGGKMSEGINFANDLGRCVIMVGLPFPNKNSPELVEKMNYLNLNMKRNSEGALPGQVHYSNLCMKAVNQSIGRAIRHKADYACVLLVDHRYYQPSIRRQLPGWIERHLYTHLPHSVIMDNFDKFFKERKREFAI